METYFTILRVFEALACVIGFISWHKLKRTYWKWFPIYLLFIVSAEFIGPFLSSHYMDDMNRVFYSYLVIPVEFMFFFWVFYSAFKETKYRRWPLWCMGVFLTSFLVDALFLTKLEFWFYSFSYTMGNLLLLLLILRFFISLVTSDAILTFRSNMLFWVSLGLMLYYLGTFPYYGLRNTLAYNYKDLYLLYTYIMFTLNCLMYLMFALGFLWSRPSTKSSLS